MNPKHPLFLGLSGTAIVLAGTAWATTSNQSSTSRPAQAQQSTPPSAESPLAWGDVDGDHLPDAVSVRADGGLSLFQNRGDGTLAEITGPAGLAAIDGVRVALLADVDNDGRADLFLGGEGASRLLASTGTGFVDLTAGSGVGELVDVCSARALDYDADGRTDLLLGGGAESALLHGVGSGIFERVEVALAGEGAAGGGFLPPVTGAVGGPAGNAGAHAGIPTAHRDALPFDISLVGRGGTSQPLVASTPSVGSATPISLGCVPAIKDQAGGCVGASSTPTLGLLYPLGMEFNISPDGRINFAAPGKGPRLSHFFDGANGDVYLRSASTAGNVILQDGGGRVGIGTTTPATTFNVVGPGRFDVGSGRVEISTPGGEVGIIGVSNTGTRRDLAWVGSDFQIQDSVGALFSVKGNGDCSVKNALGIGTTAPAFKLQVVGSDFGAQFRVFDFPGGGGTQVVSELRSTALGPQMRFAGAGAGFMDIGQNAAGDFVVEGSDSPRLVVQDSGNVGIGTTAPAFKLEVNGSAHRVDNSSTWTVTSDERLKKNIHDLEGALETLLALRGVTFEYRDPALGKGLRRGFIAQEVEKVLPEWIEDGEDGYKRLTVNGFEALAVEALREQEHRIEAQSGRIEDLQRENEALRDRVSSLAGLEAKLSALDARVGALAAR